MKGITCDTGRAPWTYAFKDLTDPRIERNKHHSLEDILILTVCAFICNADTWNDVGVFGHAKYSWLKGFLALPNGKSAIHMVSAWAATNSVVPWKIKSEEKSNEITAIPELLQLLAVDGCIVTVDAMGCQKDIAATIVDQGADDVRAHKGNQGRLHEDVKLFFDQGVEAGFGPARVDTHETRDKDHGRIETRRHWITSALEGLVDRRQCAGIQSVGMVESQREINGETRVERRCYISSLGADAQLFGTAVRRHWGVENRLHWCLDMTFREDESRVRKDHGPDDMAMLRHLTLNLLRQEKTSKIGLRGKRLKAGWDENYLSKILLSTA